MKKIIFILVMMFSISLKCQDNLHNYIIGKWEFKINVKEVIKNSNELSGLEKIAARAFSGVIEKTLDETKILFDFKENKTAAIIVTRKEETNSRVVFNWKIDENKLIPYDKEANINEGILLIKVN